MHIHVPLGKMMSGDLTNIKTKVSKMTSALFCLKSDAGAICC